MNNQDRKDIYKKAEYRKKVDEIHAPEALINATLNRIHEEEKLQNGIKGTTTEPAKNIIRPRRWAAGFTAVAAAAAMVLAIGLSRGGSQEINLVYNTVPETLVRTMEGEQAENDMDVVSYSDYLGIDIQTPTENVTLVKAEIRVEQDGDVVTEDEGTVIYNVEGNQMVVQYSKTLNVMPENLMEGAASDVDGQQVYAAVSQNGKERMAAFERGGITCFLVTYSMEEQEFEEFLVDFLTGL